MADFFYNWYVTMDLMCEPQGSVPKIGSIFFVGYGIGVILFFLPDNYGRKGSMMLTLPGLIFSQYLVLYTKNIFYIKVGFFLQGFFHLKMSNSYTHLLELVPDHHKNITSTMISAYDSLTVSMGCFLILVYDQNENNVLKLFFWLGTFAIGVYTLIVSESPKYLFAK